METKKAVLRPGFDNIFKVKATPVQSMKWIEKPKELTPEKGEAETVKQSMTFRFETVNFLKESEFYLRWIVKQREGPYKEIDIEQPISVETVEERIENSGKNRVHLREITVECDYIRLGLFNRGELTLEIDHDFRSNCEPLTTTFPFDYPAKIHFVVPWIQGIPTMGTAVDLHLEVHEIYQNCKFQLRTCEAVQWNQQVDLNQHAEITHWRPKTSEIIKKWNIGCVANCSEIHRITWPKWGNRTEEFQYKYRLSIHSSPAHNIITDWEPVSYFHEIVDGTPRLLKVKKPKLNAFTVTIEEIPEQKKPADPKWKTSLFKPTIEMEGLAESIYLPLQIEYRLYNSHGIEGVEKTVPIGDCFQLFVREKTEAKQKLRFAVEDEYSQNQFLAMLTLPLGTSPDKELVPFQNVFSCQEKSFIPWGDRNEGIETIQHNRTDKSKAIGVALQLTGGESSVKSEWKKVLCINEETGEALRTQTVSLLLENGELIETVLDREGFALIDPDILNGQYELIFDPDDLDKHEDH